MKVIFSNLESGSRNRGEWLLMLGLSTYSLDQLYRRSVISHVTISCMQDRCFDQGGSIELRQPHQYLVSHLSTRSMNVTTAIGTTLTTNRLTRTPHDARIQALHVGRDDLYAGSIISCKKCKVTGKNLIIIDREVSSITNYISSMLTELVASRNG